MEDDSDLINRTPEDEVERYAELEGIAQAAFPGDRFTYENLSRREVLAEIEQMVTRQIVTKSLVDDRGIDIELYPIIPGWEQWHMHHAIDLLDAFGTKKCAFDGTQYRSAKNQLINDLNNVVEVLDVEEIFVNGCASPQKLIDVPNEVVGFSGKTGILEAVKESPLPTQDALKETIIERESALYDRQLTLKQFQ